MTHGAGGATLYTADAEYHQPGNRVTAVDTTGAGDSFVAALLVSLLEMGDQPDYDALLRFANAVGAITTTERGAIPALPTRDRVEALLS